MSHHSVSRSFFAPLFLLICVLHGSWLAALEDEHRKATSGGSPAGADHGTSRASGDKKYRITLPDGATFEILGVKEASIGNSWWLPDGSPLAHAPKGAVSVGDVFVGAPGSISRTFEFRFLIDQSTTLSGPTILKGLGGGGSRERSESAPSDGRIIVRSSLRTEVAPGSRTSLVVNYAGGEWTTVARCPAAGGVVIQRPRGDVRFSRAIGKDGGTQITVTYIAPDADLRLVALDHESRLHRAGTGEIMKRQTNIVETQTFEDLPPAKVQEFRLQTRPWRRIEFRNVSLHRGQKTNFALFLDDRPYTPQEPTAKPK